MRNSAQRWPPSVWSEIIIYLDDAENISRITASGNVTIIQANGSAVTANEADYNRAADSALLTEMS